MDEPVRLLLTNAAAAALIAALAWGASLTVRRASVVHALWLLALLKLVTPPIAPLPLLPSWTRLALLSEPPAPTIVSMPVHDRAPALDVDPLPSASVGSGRRNAAAPTAPLVVMTAASEEPIAAAVGGWPTAPRWDWRLAAGAALGAGALSILFLAGLRFVRFSRLLAAARPAPSVVALRTSALASRIGLRRAPRVRLVAAGIPPMLWPERGGPLLLLPERLVPELRPDELDALLAHELAHVQRRDHWVRLVEIVATALFWWYPVTWWARRALRRAEERCCDEWVLRLLPHSAEAYANGLLKSLAFVADRPLPGLASGAGPVEDLEARLKEILMTRPVPPLATPVRLALAVTAALGLAVFPTHAQSSAGNDDPAVKPAPVAKPTQPAKPAPVPAPAARPAPAAKPAAAAPGARAVKPRTPAPAEGGVPGGVVGGVPGGVVGGVPGGVVGGVPGDDVSTAAPALPPTPHPTLAPIPGPTPVAASTPRPAMAPRAVLAPQALVSPAPASEPGDRSPERRALDEQRRTLEEKRRQLHHQELEIERASVELEGRAQQAELAAEAARLRAEGHAAAAARLEEQVKLEAKQVDLQKRQLHLEQERVRLETEMETAVREGALEGGKELEKKEKALEIQMREAEEQIRALEMERRIHEIRSSTEDLARSLAEQIESLKQDLPESAAQKADIEREIKRLEAAVAALGGPTPAPSPRQTPRVQP